MAFVKRRISVRVEIDVWDRGSNARSETLEITDRELSAYTFQKTIKNPNSNGAVTILPQAASLRRHFLNVVKPFDVVRIYEFGALKFIGVIRAINAAGRVDESGKPERSVTLQLSGIGGYLSESKIGVSAAVFGENTVDALDAFVNAQTSFQTRISDLVVDGGVSYQRLVTFALSTWFELVQAVSSGTLIAGLVSEYLDIREGVGSFPRPYWPKAWDLYQGDFDDISVWSLLRNLLDAPFNELFFDEGPRQTIINGSLKNLNAERTHLIIRNTPFNGSASDAGGTVEDRFDALPAREVTDLVSYTLNRNMDEVFSLFNTSSPIWDPTILERLAYGENVPDRALFMRYLYRPMHVKLNNLRIPDVMETKPDEQSPRLRQRLRETAETLHRWFRNNDQFLNGSLETHVPSEPQDDFRIGDKISLVGEDGNFYCESITHRWSYGGALMTNVGVTRGWNYERDVPMELRGDMFQKEGVFR